MNGIAELDMYIKLKDLELEHPHTDKIPLSNGRLDCPDEYVFGITQGEYRKLEQVRGDYNFEFGDNEYPCSIVALTSTQVRLKIEGSQERTIDSGAIKVDMSNIIKREKQGLCQLKDETDPTMRRLLFGKKKISGAEQSECEFENEKLNLEQKQAIMYAVGVQDMYLIWGPPGTGKTTIAPEIVSNYVRLHLEENQKIMVCSYTNKAVDNVVQKLFDDNRFRNNIVRFGDSTLTGKYKDARFDEQLKKKQNEIKEELEERIRQLRSEKEGIEEKRKLNRKEIERVEKEKEDAKGEIDTLNAEIAHTKELITDKERSLLKINLKEEIARINDELQVCRDNLREFTIKKKEIEKEIEGLDIEIPRLKGDIDTIHEQLDQSRNEEIDTANIILVVNYYLKCSKRNKFVAFLKKSAFTRQNQLYEQYKQDIFDLQLPRRNRDELEKIIYEKSEEQKNEQEKIAKFQEELNEKERELREKERKLIATKDELKSVEKSYASLSEKIQRGEKEQGELRRNLDLLAQDKLKYDRATLISGNRELNELYGELRNKEGTKKQKEVIFSSTGQKISSLKVVDEQLSDSIREINDKIKAERRNMQREMDERMEKARLAVLNEKQIIATTNLRACDRLFENETIKFDLIIMDEAGAIDLPGAVIPILKGNKYIFLGDPDQLPPIINDEIGAIRAFLNENSGLRASVFGKLFKTVYDNNQAIMLKSQYRMKREIADVVSKLYYEGLLRTPIDIEEKLGYIQDDKIVSNRYPMICFQRRFWTEYENGSAFSEHEIRFVRNIIERFKESYGDDIVDDIAIISPYRAQTNRITEEIPKIDCGTVHTFQGQEKTIIIFATAKYRRNTDGSFGKLLEGPTSKNLLNVAISRAREKFIIIGSKELFEEVPIYKALYGHIRGRGYVAPAHINGYDFENRCEMCGEVISEEYRFCRRCLVLHRLRNFLDERPRTFRAVDGDLLRSSDEVRIDDWFYRNGIEHEVERRVPVDRLRYCDWFLPRGEIYVEYWGLMDEVWYREAREVKEELYRQANLRLISIEPNDMRDLDDALGQIFWDIR